ncbi:hypothetical protein [Hymenobacter sp. B81]|uniref:hypothetical protein n=1 Tax=Hymenobacter sp. B81 TaxID=3344878 RepID=UPI0037DC20FE
MKHFLLTTALVAASIGTGFGQAKKAAAPAGKPQYAGFYIDGKLVNEIDCYGVDEYSIIYPYFSTLTSSDRFWVRVVAGSYDAAGKFVLEYSDNKSIYEESSLDAIREKYMERGYGIVNKKNLLDDYNRNRATHPISNYIVDVDNASFNVLQYTNLDPATTKGSVVYYELYAGQISGHETKWDERQQREVTNPIIKASLVYTSPKIKLTNRVHAATVATKPGGEGGAATAKKLGGKLGRALGGVAGVPGMAGQAQSESQSGPVVALLPEMQAGSCVSKGKAVTLEEVMAVGRNQFGESLGGVN